MDGADQGGMGSQPARHAASERAAVAARAAAPHAPAAAAAGSRRSPPQPEDEDSQGLVGGAGWLEVRLVHLALSGRSRCRGRRPSHQERLQKLLGACGELNNTRWHAAGSRGGGGGSKRQQHPSVFQGIGARLCRKATHAGAQEDRAHQRCVPGASIGGRCWWRARPRQQTSSNAIITAALSSGGFSCKADIALPRARLQPRHVPRSPAPPPTMCTTPLPAEGQGRAG